MPMTKRKSTMPQQADFKKRKELSWNMFDMFSSQVFDVDSKEKQGVCECVSASELDCSSDKLPDINADDRLQVMIDKCDFYVNITGRSFVFSKLSWSGLISKFHLKLENVSKSMLTFVSHLLDYVDECRLYIDLLGVDHFFYIDLTQSLEMLVASEASDANILQQPNSLSTEKVIYFPVTLDMSVECFNGLQSEKEFVLKLSSCSVEDGIFSVNVYVLKPALVVLDHPSQWVKPRRCHQTIKNVVSFAYSISGYEFGGLECNRKLNVDELFSEVKRRRRLVDSIKIDVQHKCLTPRLREYQREAVEWMLSKEKFNGNCTDTDNAMNCADKDRLHCLYDELKLDDGQRIHANKHTGYLCLNRPCAVQSPPGGILADEMGLGKTVEVLACMLIHRRPTVAHVEPLPVIKERSVSLVKHGVDNVMAFVPLTASDGNHSGIDLADMDVALHETVSVSQPSQAADASVCFPAHEELVTNSADENSSKIQLDSSSSDSDTIPLSDEFGSEENLWVHNGICSGPSVEVLYTGDCENLECLCGGQSNSHIVICHRCQSLQHAKCVGYDVTNPLRGVYLCPHCHVIETPVQSAATLIIAPSSISHQWFDEIQRHLDFESMKVLVYKGVHKQGYIQPQYLAQQDVVITSYETLRKELDYVDLPHNKSDVGRKLRNPKRFMAIPSPLVAVEWWRICLDEAQMVECVTTKSAEMALRLSAVNRWCVTGTPVQRGLDDLYGLLLFLGVDPFCIKPWWSKVLYEPFCHGIKEPLYDVLADVIWRTAKDEVLDQICIPAQTIQFHWLTFSPVEEHFYRQQYVECSQEAMKKLRNWTDSDLKLSSLDKYTLNQLLAPLVRLRQACCHPQAVRGHFVPIHKATMTMDELLEHLITKTRYDCEEAHRRFIFASTGLAGLCVIKDQIIEAVELYREMLRSVEEHKEEIRTDALQVLHIVHNLHQVLAEKPAGVGQTLMDSELQQQEQQIRSKYMEKNITLLMSSKENWISQRIIVDDHIRQVDCDWWAEFLIWVVENHLSDAVISRVHQDLMQNVDCSKMAPKFNSVIGLEYVLADHLDQLDKARDAVVRLLDKLMVTDANCLVGSVVECCLRLPLRTRRADRCTFCKIDELLQLYEAKLFFSTEKDVVEPAVSDGNSNVEVHTVRQGTWADSETEKCLRSLTSFAKNYQVHKPTVEKGQDHMKLFEALKKEFRVFETVGIKSVGIKDVADEAGKIAMFLRPMWMALRERVCAVDEINMATMRMRLRLPNEIPIDPPQANIVEPAEFGAHRMTLRADRAIAVNELKVKKGQLQYLKNLSKTKHGLEDGKNPELCPVCQIELGFKWSVLQCGHCCCIMCMQVMIHDSRLRRSVLCPFCRQTTSHADVSYVSTTKPNETNDTDTTAVKGDHSTKVEGVVRCVLDILRSDQDAKLLVFSLDVLEIVGHALTENQVKFRTLVSSGKFEENLYSFKKDAGIPVLLLPVHSGANGLNLVEATHVLLLEPNLNRAQDYQAIGRVHRIGQTRPTVVHRFLVRGTVEERIFNLLDTVEFPQVECHDAEQSALTISHLNHLFAQQPGEV